jgi:tRNA (guanine-N7-)-methyltransferase
LPPELGLELTENRRSRATEAFFGRRRGRVLRPQQSAEFEAGLLRYGLSLEEPCPLDLASLFVAPVTSVHLEIGFGGGEHLIHHARGRPDIGFIGVEPFVNGMSKLLSVLAKAPLDNIRVYHDDATQLLDWLPKRSLSGVDLFYPDPWPKKKHWKRRFVSPLNLERIARVLRESGSFRFASDIDTYVNWTIQHCRAHAAFDWSAWSSQDWNRPYPDWPGTRYEAKALREGRRAAYLTFLRS